MTSKKVVLVGIFAVSFLLVGVPYWHLPYNKISLPNALFGVTVFPVIFIAVIARLYGKCNFEEVMLASGSSFPAVVLIRIIVEVTANPKTHNLWPFELVLAAIAGIIVGALGSGAGGIVSRRFVNGRGPDRQSKSE